jgi:hypothetical protein
MRPPEKLIKKQISLYQEQMIKFESIAKKEGTSH